MSFWRDTVQVAETCETGSMISQPRGRQNNNKRRGERRSGRWDHRGRTFALGFGEEKRVRLARSQTANEASTPGMRPLVQTLILLAGTRRWY